MGYMKFKQVEVIEYSIKRNAPVDAGAKEIRRKARKTRCFHPKPQSHHEF
jgi:hypothetical protein